MKQLAVESVGLLAPGLASWAASEEILAGKRHYVNEPLVGLSATLLPPNERRRVTPTIKLALQVAQAAMAAAPECWNAAGVPTVFASSGGDSEVLDKICTALTQPDRPVSPVYFHQSVHNTPAGYWSIATGCTHASLSLSAYDGSFTASLLEAAALAWTEATGVLLVAYDLPLPFPLSERRRIVAPFAVALLLNPVVTARRLATLRLAPVVDQAAEPLTDAGLEALRVGNPAARSLPLLCAIARQVAGVVVLPGGGVNLRVEVAPA